MPKSPLQMQEFFAKIFLHFKNLPFEDIEETVILLSYGNEPLNVYKSILDEAKQHYNVNDMKNNPALHKKSRILHASEAFLKPEEGRNFVTMYYLCEYVKRAKFIFVLREQDTTAPMNIIKQTFANFFSLLQVNITDQQIEELVGPSCALVINRSSKKEDVLKDRIKSMVEGQNYLKNDKSTVLLRYILNNNRKHHFSLLDKDRITESLNGVIAKLKYFEFSKHAEIRLNSQCREFVKEQFQTKWGAYIAFLNSNLQTLVLQSCRETFQQFLLKQRMKVKCIQNQLLEKVVEFNYYNQGLDLKDELNTRVIASRRLLSFLTKYLDAIFLQKKNMIEVEYSQKVLQTFLEGLQNSKFLRKTTISQFLLSIFQIYWFLSSKFDNGAYINLTSTLIARQHFDGNMYYFLELLKEIILQELVQPGNKYPFDEVITNLSEFTAKLQRIILQQQEKSISWSFFTPRMVHQLKALSLELAYSKTVSQSRYHNVSRSIIRNNWLRFLELQPHKNKIAEDKVEQVLQYVGLELAQQKYYQLALSVFRVNWRRFSNRIIEIYERDYNFSLELLKYTFIRGEQNKKKPFQDYCIFLVKIDFAEKLNALCLEAFRWIKDKQYIQELKMKIREARGNSSSILDDEYGQEVKIQIDNALLAEIRFQFQKIS